MTDFQYPERTPGPDCGYERFAMQHRGGIELEHVHRYLHVARYCQGRRVVDVASGEGYGSFLLSQVAQKVFGVDRAHEAVHFAAEKYRRDNLSFLAGDAASLPIEDGSVDVVVSLETLEHLPKQTQPKFLAEIKRVLVPGGLLIMSTPVREVFAHFTGENPHHLHELSSDQFQVMIRRHFANDRYQWQNLFAGSYIQGVGDRGPTFFENDSEGRIQVHTSLDGLTYCLCLASDGDLPEPAGSSFYLDSYFDQEKRIHADRPEGYLSCLRTALEADLCREMRLREQVQQECSALTDKLAQADDALRTAQRELAWAVRDRNAIAADLRAETELRKQAQQERDGLTGKLTQSSDALDAVRHELGRMGRSVSTLLRERPRIGRRLVWAGWAAWQVVKSPSRLRSYLTIRRSGQFDPEWYLSNNMDVAAHPRWSMFPLLHFWLYGGDEGRSPRSGFDTGYYVARYPDVQESRQHPFQHYLTFGYREGRWPCQSPDWLHEWTCFRRLRGLRGRLASAIWEWRDLWTVKRSQQFDVAWYFQEYPDVERAARRRLWWRLRNARFAPVRLFARYLCHPIRHYLRHGVFEGRQPAPWFDVRAYLSATPDFRPLARDPFAHYCQQGIHDRRVSHLPEESTADGGVGLHPTITGTFEPLVSVIVPNYNHAEYLRRRLDSIYRQTYQNLEVILLDDCSGDDSRAILDEYAARYPDITRTLYSERNSGGVFRQWAKGLGIASGDLVWIAESDDSCEEDFLETLVPTFRDEAVLLAYARYAFVDENDAPLQGGFQEYVGSLDASKWLNSYVTTARREVCDALGRLNTIPNASGVVFRRPTDMDLLKDPDWLSMRVAGDWVFYLNHIRGGKVAYRAETCSHFRIHGANTAGGAAAREDYYGEVAHAARTAVSLYSVPDETLTWGREYFWSLFKHYFGEDRQKFESVYDFQSVLEARKRRQPTVMVSMVGFSPGGAEIMPIRLANEFRRQGISVLLHSSDCLEYHEDVRRMVHSDLPVLRTSDPSSIRKAIREFGIEVLNSQHLDIQRCVFRDPNVFGELPMHVGTLHGMIENPAFSMTPEQVRGLDAHTDVWVYTTDRNLDPFREVGCYRDGSRFVKIGNGIAPPVFDPVSRESLGLSEDAFVLCCVSRAIPEKGWREGIEAVGRARALSGRDIRLILVGSGPVYDELCESGTPDYVVLVGFDRNSSGHYACADMGFMPSRFRSESFPLTVLDCLFAGKPYLASNLGEIREMLATDEGLAGDVFDLEDWSVPVDTVAEQIAAFASGPERYERACSRVPNAAERYRIDNIARKYLEVFSRGERDASSSRGSLPAPSVSQQIRELRESGLFDEEFYAEFYGDRSHGEDALTHYVKTGAGQGFMPNDWFDAEYVCGSNPEFARIRQQGTNPLWYYARFFAGGSGLKTHSDMYRKATCPICRRESVFLAHQDTNDSYNHLRCITCSGGPRDRALALLLDEHYPDWRQRSMHESSPSNDCLKRSAKEYSSSQYYPDSPMGTVVQGFRNEDIEALTFDDATFDFIAAVDVVEHVYHPDRMVSEMVRVVKPGGAAVFTTVPDNSLPACVPQAVIDQKTGQVTLLAPPVYHGNPVADGALMTWAFGRDFEDRIREWAGCELVVWSHPDEEHAIIEGGVPWVYLLKKPADWKSEPGSGQSEREGQASTPVSFRETDFYRRFDEQRDFHKETSGFCPVCRTKATFVSEHAWLRDHYRCDNCGSTPDERHVYHLLHTLVPDWQQKAVHEVSPIDDRIERDAAHYSVSRCLGGQVAAASSMDAACDVAIARDVLQQVYAPQEALQEMLRTLVPGGVLLLTLPVFRGQASRPRAWRDAEGRAVHLERPLTLSRSTGPNGSLTVWEFGDDTVELLQLWAGDHKVTAFDDPVPELGVEGEMAEVFCVRKDSLAPDPVRAEAPVAISPPEPSPVGADLTAPRLATLPNARYCADGLATTATSEFLADPHFRSAYEAGRATGSWKGCDIEWRAYTLCWSAKHASTLEGDFVECGVYRGGYSLAAMNYVDFNRLDKRFWLVDTFAGIVEDQAQGDEGAVLDVYRKHYEDSYEDVLRLFSPFPGARVVRGVVPDVLPEVQAEKICYLHIDMNLTYPEIAAAEHFWERLVPGAVLLLDDYGDPLHVAQKHAFDDFARKRDVEVLALPTGQGLIVKP